MASYEVIANTKDMQREEWLAIRRKYIGGSDAGAICGLNKYASAIDVWRDKMEPQEEVEEPTEAMRQGTDLEDYVAYRFSEATGRKVRKNNNMMVSRKYPFMLADIDRQLIGENALLECKTTTMFNQKAWEDGLVPQSYYCQVQHYLAVTGMDRAYIAVLIYGRDFIWYQIDPDPEYMEHMIHREAEFYHRNMVDGIFPSPDGSKAASDALIHLYPGGNTDVFVSDSQALSEDIRNYLEARELAKNYDRQKKLLEQTIQMRMGNHELLQCGSYEVKWTPVESKRLDTKRLKADHPDIYDQYAKTTTTRRFSAKENKEENND